MNTWLKELMKRATPDKTEPWPEFERSVTTLSGEMPNEVASMKDRKIRPLSVVERMLYGVSQPGTLALTYPTGTIAYNKKAIEEQKLRPEDVMAHELTHIKQLNERGPLRTIAQGYRAALTDYQDRDFEQEAFDKEISRAGLRKRTKDIRLKGDR